MNASKFNQKNQEVGEVGFHTYLIALRNMAESCNFCSCPAMSDSLLRDRIALGIQSEDARERLFQEKKARTDICRASESATIHLQAFGGKHEESTGCTEGPMIFPRRTVNRVNELKPHLKKKKNTELRELKCKFCSRSHVLKKELCPAWSKRCNVCLKINH